MIRLTRRRSGNEVFINPKYVTSVTKYGLYTLVYYTNGSIIVRESVQEVVEKLK